MKKILCLAFVLFTAIGVFAQEKTIQKAEFNKIRIASVRMLSSKAHREIVTDTNETIYPHKHQSNISSKVYPTHKSVTNGTTEILPGVGWHSIKEESSHSGNKKTEQITIGGKAYTREGNEKWKVKAVKVAVKAKSTSKSENAISSIDEYTEYKFIGTEKLGNQNTKVYLVIIKNRPIKSKYSIKSVVNGTSKYWFGKDGMLLKEEIKREYSETGKPPVLITEYIKVNELDPKIKIKAPKLD